MSAVVIVLATVPPAAAAVGLGLATRRFLRHAGQRADRLREPRAADRLSDLNDPAPDPHWPEVRRQLRPPPPVWPPQMTDRPPE